MKFTLFLILLFISQASLGQSTRPTKKELLKVLNLTMSQKPYTKNNNSCENGLCGEWWSINKNGQFYKSDTVKFYNSSNFYSIDSSYCTFKIWDFDKNNKFSQSGAEMCNEPPLRSNEVDFSFGTKKNKKITPNKFRILQKNEFLIIETLIDLTPFEKYKVLSIDENKSIGENAYILILVRQKLK